MQKIFSSILAMLMLFSLSGCFSADEEETNYYYVTFKVDGEQKSYAAEEGWGFDYQSYDGSWFCMWGPRELDTDGFDIMLPGSAQTGSSFNMYSSGFDVFFTYNGDLYWVRDQPFNLTVIQWGPDGSVVSGTFSGRLVHYTDSGPVYVDVTEGRFDAENNGDWIQ